MVEFSQYPKAANGVEEDKLHGPDEDCNEEETRELNRRSGKGLYLIMAVIAVLATAALVVASTSLVQHNRDRSFKATKKPANLFPPSQRGASTAYARSFRGGGTTTGLGATENDSTQSSVNSFVHPTTYLQRNDIAVYPTSAPTLVSTEAVAARPAPVPTEVGVVTEPLDWPPDTVSALPSTEYITSVDTPAPTSAITVPTTLNSTETEVVTTDFTPEPTSTPSLSPSSPRPTSTPSARPSAQPTNKPSFSLSPSHQPTEKKYCVNIKFITDNFPRDNGFTFLATKSGEVLHEEDAGFMTKRKSEYLISFCDLSLGSYTLVVTDTSADGMFAYGKGSYVVDIDGQVVLVGGRFRTYEISHEILVGVNAIMSETEQGFLDAHNSRRKGFHESQDVSYRPMTWSAELAAGASAWAKEKAKTCTNDEGESGMFGQNASSQRLLRPDLARSPDMIVSWWMNGFDAEQSTWGANLQPGSAVLWRAALYVGCAAEIAEIENCPEGQRACYCQVTNCRYARTTNCAVKKNNWLQSVIDDNGPLCNPLFCPGADETG